MALRRGARSVETTGQRTGPGKSSQVRRAFSCTDCFGDRLHEPHGPFLLGLRIHFARAVSSSFSCFSIGTRTCSLDFYPSMLRQERPEKFPNSVTVGDC